MQFDYSNEASLKAMKKTSLYYLDTKRVHAFVLPDNSHLSYAHIYDMKEKNTQFKWARTYITQRLMNFNPKQKDRQTRLGLWTSRSNLQVVCADFDYLPDGFSDFDSLQVYMKSIFSYRSLIIKSKSGKIKALFMVDLKEKLDMTTEIALASLQKILPSDLFDAIDKSYCGLSIMFIRPSVIPKIQTWLKSAYIYDAVIEDKEPHFFEYHVGDLPKCFDSFISKDSRGRSEREGFVRLIMNIQGLSIEFGLPNTKIARELGVNQKTVSRWRNDLIKLGLLEVTSDFYCKGRTAKQYKAKGKFKKVLDKKYNKKSYLLAPVPDSLPDRISDGNWNETAWELSLKFVREPEKFISLARKIPDVNRKNRLHKFVSAVNNRRKFFGLPKIAA